MSFFEDHLGKVVTFFVLLFLLQVLLMVIKGLLVLLLRLGLVKPW